ncbi:serine hydrolase domain-containing protein [Pseudarthrobacter sp. J75]|uniref:serine hydrolase domain-containing protein n=1 Tax=unclassified Pseudarthrobacter TaxID=2647000 RepID=UPI002E7FE158|nr:serine hydrolase domain-containing protein [Pseudarthrobacter sp. J75]MEE2524429.1 serine hydrolase domain-containing protein [Pseudarthrobacter sp. J47]MEE2529860.1 serine hydrolase domain-containing protein [Pseudarthrobacter sp. J75]
MNRAKWRTSEQRPGLAAVAAVAAALVLAGCSPEPSAPGAAPSTTPATTGPTAAQQGCVPDPAAVVKAPPQNRTAGLPAALVGELDAAVAAAFAETGAPGAVVGVSNDRGTWVKGYGLANAATGEAMPANAHTRVGSVTKTFTGTAIVQLDAAGALSLDDTISEYRADVPNGDRITLRMLSNMTSGVASYTFNEQFLDTMFSDPSQSFASPDLIRIGLADSPSFEPGTSFEYSNTNTLLLGSVVEQVTGKPLATVVNESIITPLGLAETSWPGTSPEMPEPYAHGVTQQGRDDGSLQDPTHWNPSWGAAAGEVISTVPDLLAYGHALATGQGILDPAAAEKRLTEFPAGKAAYGTGYACYGGWVGHEGTLPGYNTHMVYDTASNTTAVVAVNSDIHAGACTPGSPTPQDLSDRRCLSPAVRILIPLTKALGHELVPPGS